MVEKLTVETTLINTNGLDETEKARRNRAMVSAQANAEYYTQSGYADLPCHTYLYGKTYNHFWRDAYESD